FVAGVGVDRVAIGRRTGNRGFIQHFDAQFFVQRDEQHLFVQDLRDVVRLRLQFINVQTDAHVEDQLVKVDDLAVVLVRGDVRTQTRLFRRQNRVVPAADRRGQVVEGER